MTWVQRSLGKVVSRRGYSECKGPGVGENLVDLQEAQGGQWVCGEQEEHGGGQVGKQVRQEQGPRSLDIARGRSWTVKVHPGLHGWWVSAPATQAWCCL